eukprot:s465_g11.t1
MPGIISPWYGNSLPKRKRRASYLWFLAGQNSCALPIAKVAIGKLGVVLAEGRSPRLVVDSSISNVTANTILPNHMLLPRISDVIACAPTGPAQEDMLQLTLDVSKAHRRILIRPDDQGLLCFYVTCINAAH